MDRSITNLTRINAVDDIRLELTVKHIVPPPRAIRIAAKYGHADAVRMLHKEFNCRIDKWCIVAAIRSRNFELVEYCAKNNTEGIHFDATLLYLYLKSGEIEELEKILEDIPLGGWDCVYPTPAHLAAEESNVTVLDWLLCYNDLTRRWVDEMVQYTFLFKKKRKVILHMLRHESGRYAHLSSKFRMLLKLSECEAMTCC